MRKLAAVGIVVGLVALAAIVSCVAVRRNLVKIYPVDYTVKGDSKLAALFSGKDEQRERIAISLAPVVTGFPQLIGGDFVPGAPSLMILLQKEGQASWASVDDGKSGPLFKLDVTTASEMGLLGLAFHPRYLENGKLYFHYTLEKDGKDTSRVEEWTVAPGSDLRKVAPKPARIILELEQPYPNHNGGHLRFGPDGFLYIGFGDGGYRADPHGHGQDLGTLLGDMLRIDVDAPEGALAYGIPKDNPYVGKAGLRPEIWASGLRNPWRYAFDLKGRLVVADVGQDAWEEVGFIARGDNGGWNHREGRHCFAPAEGCLTDGLVEPFFEYARDEGQSITGGEVYSGSRIPALAGKYVFGDFVTGRLWAVDLPEAHVPRPPLSSAFALGKWPVLPTSFSRDANGELYLADFGSGTMFRLDP